MLPRKHFARRVLLHASIAFATTAFALGIGITGYLVLARLSLIDAFLNAAMILGGMGPVDTLPTPAAKLFAGFYALFSGIVFIGVAGVVTAPFVHRLLHHIHMDDDEFRG